MHPDIEKYLDQFKWIHDKESDEEESYVHSSDEEYPYSDSELEGNGEDVKEKKEVNAKKKRYVDTLQRILILVLL
mgnify:CR=1 FL=1